MGRMYTVQISNMTTSTALGALELTGITNGIIVLHSAFVGSSSESGDAQADTQRIQIVRHNASAAGGTTIAASGIRPHLANEAAFTGAAEKSNTYAATNAVILTETFNIQAGWYYTPTPEERIVIPPTSVSATYGRIAIDLPDVPASQTSYSVRATFEVIG